MIHKLRYQLAPTGSYTRLDIPNTTLNENNPAPCNSCNRARDIANDASALDDLDNLVEQSTLQANSLAAVVEQNQAPSATQSTEQNSSTHEAQKPAESVKTNSTESKSQFVPTSSTAVHTALTRESAPLRVSQFLNTTASQSFHTASNSMQSSLRNTGSKDGEIISSKAAQTQLQSSARTEVRTNSNTQTASIFSTQNLSNTNIKTQPNLSELNRNIMTPLANEVAGAIPASSFTGSRLLAGNVRSFQGSGILASPSLQQNTAVNTNVPALANKSFTGLLQSVVKTFPLLSGFPLSLQNFVMPLFKNLGLESLRISSQKFTEALTGFKTVAPLTITSAREIAPQRAMSFSMQFFAKLEKNMLNFFNIMQGAYLQIPEGEISEGDLLTQQLALLRNLQEKNEKKEKKKKVENKDEFLMARVQTKQDLLQE